MKNPKASISRLQLSNFKLNTLLDITLAINDNVATNELLEQYEKLLREDLNIGKVLIFRFNQQHWNCILNSGYGEEILDAESIANNYLTKYDEISNVSSTEEGFFKGFDVVIPVYNKSEAVAYVLVGDIDEDREGISPTIKHLKFIQTITNVIVVAIENKRLYKESLAKEAMKKELELASKMQSMLIPNINNLPRHDSLSVAAYYKPHSVVGGDYYDFLRLSPTEYGFCIADVSGKGISAAILMSNFQANLRALFTAEANLEELILKLNDTVMNNANGEKFITFFIAKYNTTTRELTYINAGHNQPVLQSEKRNEIVYLKKGCIGLGMLDEIPALTSGSLTIDIGDRLVCYTDGLSEAENEAQEEFGTIPLEGCLSEAKTITGAIDKLNETLSKFITNTALADDISILGIEFH